MIRRAWIAVGVFAAALALGQATAQAVTTLHAPQTAGATGLGVVHNYAVGADGGVTALASTPLGAAAHDIAMTPDGRFAYVTLGSNQIVQLARDAGGVLQPNPNPNAATVATGTAPRGVIVDPQGARVYYANSADATVGWRPINGDGTLGAETLIPLARGDDPRFLAMRADGTRLYVATLLSPGLTNVVQFAIDPATGAATPAGTAAWPVVDAPDDAGRMTIAPGGSVLYATANTSGAGIARYAIDATGALDAGTVDAATVDTLGEHSLAIAPGGAFGWAPSSTFGAASGRINQFTVGAGGALAQLAPPVATTPANEALAHPDGATLYVAQNGALGLWSIAPGGTLTARPGGTPDPMNTSGGLVLAPSRAPVASFAAAPRPAGQPTSFDASASSDPDGTVVRYDWDFGDGTQLANGGPAPAHVYAAPGTYTAALTVTDADGTSTAKLWTGARMLRNGGPSARTAQALTIAPAATVAPPRPHKGRSVTVAVERGTILVRVPGSRRYVRIEELSEIPLGSIIDARKGRVRITTEVDARTGRTESSLFWGWYFRVTQTKGSRPITVATLVNGSFAGCTRRTTAARAASEDGLVAQTAAKRKRSKRKVRHLFGDGKGSFRTSGKRSSATVRGTRWLVQDRCDGTLTRVYSGRVDVRDFRTRKTVRLRAGRSYLAKAP